MRTKELMIGDWVYGKEKKKYGRVDKLEHDVEDESVEPIPLTEEILEKNGFKYNEAESVGEWYAYDFPLGKGFFIEKNPMDKTFRITDHRFINVRYVHEFQQLLRLCKIDKDIEL